MPTRRVTAPDRDLCAKCGSQFPDGQVCSACETDGAIILRAVEVLKRRRTKQTFTGDVIIRLLERAAARYGGA